MKRTHRLKNNCRHRCPVCWQNIVATRDDHISLHLDSIGRTSCPASGEPFTIAQPYYPQQVYVLRRTAAA